MNESSKFVQLEKELKVYIPSMSKASDRILEAEVSRFPIFIIHKGEMSIGVELVSLAETNANWSVNVSTLEDFHAKKLIEEKKIDSFKTIFKNPKTHLCMFVLSELGAKFIFLPKE